MLREDPERITAIRSRDPETLQEVVREHLPVMLRAARAAGLAPEHAEDVVQETFLTFIQKAGQFDGRARVRTWLFGILYKKVLEARRNAGRDARFDEIDTVLEQRFKDDGSWSRPPEPTDARLLAGEIRRQLEDCLDALPARHRMAFVLREVERLSTEEICKILDVTANHLGVILHRGRNGLRECLEAKGTRGAEDAAL